MMRIQPPLKTRKALLIIDVQTDFTSPSGKFPIAFPGDFFERLNILIPCFRFHDAEIVWIRSEFRAPRTFNRDDDGDHIVASEAAESDSSATSSTEGEERETGEASSEEELLKQTLKAASQHRSAERIAAVVAKASTAASRRSRKNGPERPSEAFLSGNHGEKQCCMPSTDGAESPIQARFADPARDIVIWKSYYSAFTSTALLDRLRYNLVTELYLCGCMTNISIYATAIDAARHGFNVHLVDDCLAYYSESNHRLALAKMTELVDSAIIPSQAIINQLDNGAWSKGGEGEDRPSMLMNALAHASYDKQPSRTHINARESSRSPRSKGNNAGSGRKDSKLQTLDKVASARGKPNHEINVTKKDVRIGAPSTGPPPSELPPLPVELAKETFLEAPSPLEPDSISNAPGPSAIEPSQKLVSKRKKHLPIAPILGPDDEIGEGDSKIIYNVPFSEVSELSLPHIEHRMQNRDIFSIVKDEVKWSKMRRVGGEVPRLVTVQGQFGPDGSMPVYRHPTDQSLPLQHFSPQVLLIKEVVENLVGHEMNHVLIQLYRGGQDFISEHSDKTLDIVRGSSIVNVSFGAQRTMRLRTKKSKFPVEVSSAEVARQTQNIPMPHSSVFVLGPHTNMRWLHGINPDKRPLTERTEGENAYNGERISLTFRYIGTFLGSTGKTIWGQGACAKTRDASNAVINGNPAENQKLINAFGTENQSSKFDWDATYGNGFDVLHFTGLDTAPMPLLYLSGNNLSDWSCKICLEELGVQYQIAGVSPEEAGVDYRPTVSFHDADIHKTQIDDVSPIVMYLGRVYRDAASRPTTTRSLTFILDYLAWRRTIMQQLESPHTRAFIEAIESLVKQTAHLTGDNFTVTDCAYWPLIDEVIETWSEWDETAYPHVASYHERVLQRESVKRTLWADAIESGKR